jgi:membrane-associated phospholipid phosphatase
MDGRRIIPHAKERGFKECSRREQGSQSPGLSRRVLRIILLHAPKCARKKREDGMWIRTGSFNFLGSLKIPELHLRLPLCIALCVCACSTRTLGQGTGAEAIPTPAARDGAGDPAYVEPFFSKEYGHLLLADVKHVLTTPMRWDSQQWLWAGATVGGLAAMTFLDEPFSEFIERNHNHTTDQISTHLSKFGAEYSLVVLAGYYIGGQIFDSPKARAVAQDGIAASIIASGMITPTLKLVFGRARHEAGEGAHDFDFFNTQADSFPSGHTTQAFAVASVVAAHYESIWVKLSAYGAASLVGYSRIQKNKHWPTDVAAGALIGTLVGNSVVRFNQLHRSQHEPRVTFMPLIDTHTVGLCMSFHLD